MDNNRGGELVVDRVGFIEEIDGDEDSLVSAVLLGFANNLLYLYEKTLIYSFQKAVRKRALVDMACRDMCHSGIHQNKHPLFQQNRASDSKYQHYKMFESESPILSKQGHTNMDVHSPTSLSCSLFPRQHGRMDVHGTTSLSFSLFPPRHGCPRVTFSFVQSGSQLGRNRGSGFKILYFSHANTKKFYWNNFSQGFSNSYYPSIHSNRAQSILLYK